MYENPVGKMPLRRSRLRWGNVIRKDVEALNKRLGWKAQAPNRGGWRIGFVSGWY